MSDSPKLQSEVRAESMKLTAVVMRLEAVNKLFDSAAFLGQGKEMDDLRLQIHALIDARLDHNARIMQLTREMMDLPPP